MNTNGWIKLHRKILDNEIFRYDPTAWRVFEVLLLLADREGTLTIGREQLAGWTGLKNTTAYSALKRLEKCKMVDRSSNNKYTRISICKWSDYQQSSDKSDDNEMTTTQQPNDNQMTHYKNKELRIENKELNPPKGEMAISEDAKIDWEYWETQMAPITRNQIFHKNTLIRLKKAHGRDNLHKMIRLAAAAHEDRFASQRVKPSTPKELEDKWDALMIWGKSKYTQQTTKILDATS